MRYLDALEFLEALDDLPAEPAKPSFAGFAGCEAGALNEILKPSAVKACRDCQHQIRPGRSEGYCASELRNDLMKAYGVSHPAKRLPGDSGASCEAFCSDAHTVQNSISEIQ